MDYIVEMVSVNKLIPHPRNELYKTLLAEDSEEYRFMMSSMASDGLRNPLLVQQATNIVISGHTRLKIARQLGFEEIPVRYLDVDDEAAETMLVQDNVERAGKEKDLIKLARSIDRMYNRFSKESSRKDALTRIGESFAIKDRQIDRMRSLLRLISPMQNLVSQEQIGLKAGAAIATGLGDAQQLELWDEIRDRVSDKSWRLTEEQARFCVLQFQNHESGNSEHDDVPAGDAGVDLVGTSLSSGDVQGEGETSGQTSQQELAQRDFDMHIALQRLDKDQRAIQRMISQTLPALKSVADHSSPKEVKKEIALVKKTMNDYLKALSEVKI